MVLGNGSLNQIVEESHEDPGARERGVYSGREDDVCRCMYVESMRVSTISRQSVDTHSIEECVLTRSVH